MANIDWNLYSEGHLYCDENSPEMLAFDSAMLPLGVEHRYDCGVDAPGVCYLVPLALKPQFAAQAASQGLGMEWGGAGPVCHPPGTITKYGIRLRAGDGSDNWLDPNDVATPITVEGSAEFFIHSENELVEINYQNLAPVFKANGFIVAARPYNLVGEARAETAGDWTSYTCDAVFANEGTPGEGDDPLPSEPDGSLTGLVDAAFVVYAQNTVYIGDNNDGATLKLRVVDVTDRSNPTLVTSLNITTSAFGFTGLDTDVNNLYVVAGDGLGDLRCYVYSLANPQSPSLLTSFIISNAGSFRVVKVESGYLYLMNNSGGVNLIIYDIGNIFAPVALNGGGTILTGALPAGITIYGNYLYYLDWLTIGAGVLHAVDIHNKTSPSVVFDAGEGNWNGVAIAIWEAEKKLLAAYTGNGSTTHAEIISYDISDPASPVHLGTFNSFTTESLDFKLTDIAVKSFRVYVSIGESGGATSTKSLVTLDGSVDPVVVLKYADADTGSSSPIALRKLTVRRRHVFAISETALYIFKKGGRAIGDESTEVIASSVSSEEVSASVVTTQSLSATNGATIGGSGSFGGDLYIGTKTAISGSNTITLFVSSAATKPGVRYLSTGTGTGKWQFSNDGSSWNDLGSGSITGSGTTGKLAKFTGASAIGDSIISESGSVASVAGNVVVGSGTAISGSNTFVISVSSASTKPGLRYLSTGTGTGKWQFSNDGSSWTDMAGGGVTGSGTTGKIPKWSGSTALTDSIISDDGSTVSVAGALNSSGNAVIGSGTAISGTNTITLLVSSASTKPGVRYLSTGTGTGKWQYSNDGSTWIDFADVYSSVSSSVDSEVVLFSGTGGKTIKRATGTGVAHLTSGVLSVSNVVESEITLADNTTNDVSTTKHGFAPKLPNDATVYLDGTGNYSSPGGGAAHEHGIARIVGAAAQTVLDMPDYIFIVETLTIDGLMVDPVTYTLSADGSQITLDSALSGGEVITASYVILGG